MMRAPTTRAAQGACTPAAPRALAARPARAPAAPPPPPPPRRRAARAAASAAASAADTDAVPSTSASTSAAPEPWTKHSWTWRGHRTVYATTGCGPPVVLVHGFGASHGHFKRNAPALAAAGYKVYALDLLGFGASDKPVQAYTMEVWRDQILDFVDEFAGRGARVALVGNSIGSLAALMAGAELAAGGRLAGVALLACAGGLNNKAVADDWRVKVFLPLFALIDALLSTPPVARFLFDRFRTRDNIAAVLKGVYPLNPGAVDDDLVDMLYGPSCDAGALEAFVSIVTGPPGPRPEALVPRLGGAPLLVLWGTRDAFTPGDGPVGRYFRALPAAAQRVRFVDVPGGGHCLHDEVPDAVHAELLPWLEADAFAAR